MSLRQKVQAVRHIQSRGRSVSSKLRKGATAGKHRLGGGGGRASGGGEGGEEVGQDIRGRADDAAVCLCVCVFGGGGGCMCAHWFVLKR